jgi:O-antigen/teichoic acid export membrane protein
MSMHDATRKSTLIDRVARGAVATFFIYGAGAALTYCSQFVIARVVGVEMYGVYAYVFAWIGLLAYLSTLGFEVGLLRFVPAYETQRAWPLLRGVIQYAQRRSMIVSLCVIVIGTCVAIASRMSPELRNTFVVGFILVPILALLWIRCSIVRAYGGSISAVAPNRVVRDGMLIVLVAILSLGPPWAISASSVMVATVVSSAVALSFTELAIRRLRPRPADNAVPVYDAAAWRRAALPLVIIGTTEALMNRTGVLLLGWLDDTRNAGIYSLAFNIAFVVALPQVAVSTLFAPTISSLFVRNDRVMLQTLVTRAASWTFCAGAGIALVLFILAEPLLAWFGPGFEAGVPALRILLVGQAIVAGAGAQLHVLNMTGLERSGATMLVACAAANAVVSTILIEFFGLMGAAIGSAGTLIVWNLAMSIVVWRRLHLVPGVLALVWRPSREWRPPPGG